MAASISARSGRRPCVRPFHVSFGKSDTRSSQTVPGVVAAITSRPAAVVPLAVNRRSTFCQSASTESIRADASTVPPASSMLTTNDP